MKILNFGSANIDAVYDVHHIVRGGETLAADGVHRYPGGKGLNQSIACARAGLEVYFAGCIGEDGAFLRELAEACGVNTRYMRTVEVPTGQAVIQVDREGQNSILINRGANAAITSAFIDEVLSDFAAGDLVILQNEISNVPYLIHRAAERGMRVVLNPSPFDESLRAIDFDDVSYLVLNETEAASFLPNGTPMDFVLWAQKNYPNLCVVLTLGEKGCICLTQGKTYTAPAYAVEVVDTTAAGDTFMGYFVAGLTRDPMDANLRFANAASALAISASGAAVSIPCAADVERAVRTLRLGAGYNEVEYKKEMILQYIQTALDRATLSELAARMGYSAVYLGKWIITHLGTTFAELLQRARCEAAAYELKNTARPISEIIARVGYTNESHFRKLFQREYGMLPLEYRKS